MVYAPNKHEVYGELLTTREILERHPELSYQLLQGRMYRGMTAREAIEAGPPQKRSDGGGPEVAFGNRGNKAWQELGSRARNDNLKKIRPFTDYEIENDLV